jgi:hypothetical protein
VKILAYVVAVISFCTGIAMIMGLITTEATPPEFRYMAGIVLMLLGIYRFAVTYTKKKTYEDSEQTPSRHSHCDDFLGVSGTEDGDPDKR